MERRYNLRPRLNEAVAKCRALDKDLKNELGKRERKEREMSSLQESLTAQKEKTDRQCSTENLILSSTLGLREEELKQSSSRCNALEEEFKNQL
ncbi:golgin subfamily A member 6-like protein 6 [Lates japonicus]|uniref:Golgin subfamily A member 6-like protein 6 n=1 Tax=Lates japonicus TaxID=270547 RepID=A0AAD3QVU5_LATJO|nr:golgin subfamily A member 6-like protein 6 [Lates japonicus]